MITNSMKNNENKEIRLDEWETSGNWHLKLQSYWDLQDA